MLEQVTASTFALFKCIQPWILLYLNSSRLMVTRSVICEFNHLAFSAYIYLICFLGWFSYCVMRLWWCVVFQGACKKQLQLKVTKVCASRGVLDVCKRAWEWDSFIVRADEKPATLFCFFLYVKCIVTPKIYTPFICFEPLGFSYYCWTQTKIFKSKMKNM